MEHNGKLHRYAYCRDAKRFAKEWENWGFEGKLRGMRNKKFHCKRHELRSPRDICLSEDATDVGFHRLLTDAEICRNFPVHEPFGDENDDVTLPFAETIIHV
jgi:hypothetical protein